MEDQQAVASTDSYQAPQQSQARIQTPTAPTEDPSATTRKILTILLVLIFAVGIGALLARTVLTGGEQGPTKDAEQDGRILEAEVGDLVGLYLRNGTVYFGNVVYEDDKSILLRDVYRPLGYFDPEGGSNPRFQVVELNATTPQAGAEQLVSKEEVLFSASVTNSAVSQAIENYTPPTPTPQPENTPTPVSEPGDVQGEQTDELPETLPSPAASPTPTGP